MHKVVTRLYSDNIVLITNLHSGTIQVNKKTGTNLQGLRIESVPLPTADREVTITYAYGLWTKQFPWQPQNMESILLDCGAGSMSTYYVINWGCSFKRLQEVLYEQLDATTTG